MILLTGGAGFIGSCFLWKLNQLAITDVIVVDHLGFSEKWRNLTNKKFNDYIEKDDFIRLIRENKFDKKIETIVHLGACSTTTHPDATYLLKNNYIYSKDLLEWSIRNNTRFIYASSAATYGDGTLGYSDEDEITLQLQPLNMYAYSKHLFDLWILKNNLSNKVVGLKYFNVFGPNEYHKGDMRSVIAKKFTEVRDEKKLKLFKSYKERYKDGEQKRDFIYVKDAVEVTYFFLLNHHISGIYNVGSGNAQTWNKLAISMFNFYNYVPYIKYIDMPENLKDKYQYFTQADLTKLRNAGYNKEFTDFSEAVKEYMSFIESNDYL